MSTYMNTHMKKIISKIVSLVVAVAITATALVGCDNTVKQTNDSLTLYTHDLINSKVSNVISAFETRYPDVALNVVDLSDLSQEEYNTKLTTDINAGKGPDVIFINESFMKEKDIYKLMTSGVFSNLNEYFESDNSFKQEEYNKAVMDAGVFNGERFIVPLTYNFTAMLTTKEILERDGFVESDYSNNANLSKMLIQNINNKIVPNNNDLLGYHELMGVSLFDYPNQQVTLNAEALKQSIELYKAIYNSDLLSKTVRGDSLGRWYEDMNDKEFTFEIYGGHRDSQWNLNVESSAIYNYSEPILIPILDSDNKIRAKVDLSCAIRSNSTNQQNAYNFIQIMLSDSYQNYIENGIPIKKHGVDIAVSKIVPKIYGSDDSVKSMWSGRVEYVNRQGEEKRLGIPFDIKTLPKDYCDNYIGITEKIDTAYFPTPISSKMYEYFIPYYKDETSYEECLGQAKQQLQIYISE